MNWNQIWLLPDPENGWSWATLPIVGVPALVRVLVALKRAGIATVNIGDITAISRTTIDAWANRWDLPRLVWHPGPAARLPLQAHLSSMLAIRWGVIFSPKLLQWLEQHLGSAEQGRTYVTTPDGQPFILSGWFRQGGVGMWAVDSPRDNSSRGAGIEKGVESDAGSPTADCAPSTLVVPEDIFCRTVEELRKPGGERSLLAMVGKATDRWHVVWVRNWSFGGLRWLAAHRVSPNQVTGLGFLVAVLACMLLASGQYGAGILGALLLYGSWVLDCMDGTLARLTFAESSFGQKLDTVLGHITNLAIFSALIWAVYGQERWWIIALSAFLILGGILMAYRVSEEEKRLRPAGGGNQPLARLEGFLDKINHRDYAVIILVLALINGFKYFLWVSLVGVQLFWLAHLWLIYQHRQVKGAEGGL